MNKVYCKNCEYLIGDMYCEQYMHYLGKTFGTAENKDVNVYLINHNNSCPAYKRKWWKFWVKG